MQYAINENKERVQATPAVKAKCECCKSEVLAKCGTINIWHFAHKNIEDCDSWYEPESEWHREWKSNFPEENQEVVIENHRADVKLQNIVVELQNSPISSEMIEEREDFYGKMIWIVNGESFRHNFLVWKKDNYYTFKWKHARKSWGYANYPVIIDFGNDELFLIKKLYIPKFTGWGKLINKKDLIKKINKYMKNKYNIGDKVWLKEYGKIIESKVTGIIETYNIVRSDISDIENNYYYILGDKVLEHGDIPKEDLIKEDKLFKNEEDACK